MDIAKTFLFLFFSQDQITMIEMETQNFNPVTQVVSAKDDSSLNVYLAGDYPHS